MANAYREHVTKHLRGSRNPRASMREAALLWNGSATKANPGQGSEVTKWAILGLLAYVGLTWLGPRLKDLQVGRDHLFIDATLPDCGFGTPDQTPVHALGPSREIGAGLG